LAGEAAALRSWQAGPVPAVIEFDKTIGALLLEAIEPGTPLAELPTYPANAKLTPLFKSLHQPKTSDRGFPPLERRVTQLFESWEKQRASRAELRELVPPEIFDRGRRLAIRLAREPAPATLLHGDLTPANILDGGSERGLVAIDPAPCFGDPAFDTIDLLFWKADRVETITTRAQRLAATIGAPAERMLDWCTAFAGMALLDLADLGRAVEPQVEELMALAAHAPSAQVPSGR
jgi:streptomycin 6-kinase